MGIFDKLKKKPEPEPIIDEKRIKEIEKYQAYSRLRDKINNAFDAFQRGDREE